MVQSGINSRFCTIKIARNRKKGFLQICEKSLSRLRNQSKAVALEVAHIPTPHEKLCLGAWRGVKKNKFHSPRAYSARRGARTGARSQCPPLPTPNKHAAAANPPQVTPLQHKSRGRCPCGDGASRNAEGWVGGGLTRSSFRVYRSRLECRRRRDKATPRAGRSGPQECFPGCRLFPTAGRPRLLR